MNILQTDMISRLNRNQKIPERSRSMDLFEKYNPLNTTLQLSNKTQLNTTTSTSRLLKKIEPEKIPEKKIVKMNQLQEFQVPQQGNLKSTIYQSFYDQPYQSLQQKPIRKSNLSFLQDTPKLKKVHSEEQSFSNVLQYNLKKPIETKIQQKVEQVPMSTLTRYPSLDELKSNLSDEAYEVYKTQYYSKKPKDLKLKKQRKLIDHYSKINNVSKEDIEPYFNQKQKKKKQKTKNKKKSNSIDLNYSFSIDQPKQISIKKPKPVIQPKEEVYEVKEFSQLILLILKLIKQLFMTLSENLIKIRQENNVYNVEIPLGINITIPQDSIKILTIFLISIMFFIFWKLIM